MPGDELRKVKSGDRFAMPAAAYNAFIEAAIAERNRQINQTVPITSSAARAEGLVLVKNASGAAQDRFAVLGIDNVIFNPTDNLSEFHNNFSFSCITPASPDHDKKFVVLFEPLDTDKIGLAYVTGVCPVQVAMSSADDQLATVLDGDATKLQSSASTGVRILWAESGTGTKWAVVDLGFGGGGDSGFKVRLHDPVLISGFSNRWSYSFTEVTPQRVGAYQDQTDPRTGTCYNRVEAYNNSTGMLGIGLTMEDLFTAGKTLKPLGVGVYTCWRLKDCDGADIYEVEHQNPVQVVCT